MYAEKIGSTSTSKRTLSNNKCFVTLSRLKLTRVDLERRTDFGSVAALGYCTRKLKTPSMPSVITSQYATASMDED